MLDESFVVEDLDIDRVVDSRSWRLVQPLLLEHLIEGPDWIACYGGCSLSLHRYLSHHLLHFKLAVDFGQIFRVL